MMMMTNHVRRWLAGLFLLFVSTASFAQAGNAREYVIGAGDILRINVFQAPELSVETRVSEAGTISYPLLGQVQLGGLSVRDAEQRIADGLRRGNYVKQPQVSILVTQVRGNQVSVLGYVNRPGRYPLELATTRLTDMLAMAGGVAQTGADVVVVTGTRGGKPFRTEIDLPAMFSGEAQIEDMVMQNGDVIYVDRMPTIYIYGHVQRPGPVRLERGMTVMQALAAGGGPTLRGTERGLRIHRRGPDGNVAVIEPSMHDALRNGDVLFVRESLF
ncbi:MAG TPA: polysaccharide export protein EpsE [Burkholderiaceae bacterium]|nr:polysaccharide export protein EpsE [Burkholderiaceae bacterium]